ncbi:glycoside hydrolase family 15 protein [Roseiterribacter gracilis]|uniref:Trehalase n=1 Tax=Roseiterribacter gracilis TaxID=2812848 RepID=A0A8S8XG27_9PROT|nr:glucoamylase [Rhodospirillales bacterium TMPK1]
MANPIESYALIGDRETAALVGKDGSIDWLCWPRFDSGACFAALVGTRDNGRWRIAAADQAARITRTYRDGTMILVTRFETDTGIVELVDCMPQHDPASSVLRLVVGIRGTVRMQLDLTIRFDYGSSIPWITRLEDGALRAVAGPDMVVLRTPVELVAQDLAHVATFDVKAGQRVPFALTYVPSWNGAPPVLDAEREIEKSEAAWRVWSSGCNIDGPWAPAVLRSLLTLKTLTYEPTGGMVAAPTTSLPEFIGGERNWDYRFCWLRDASLTLHALMRGGRFDEARDWRDWLLRAVAGAPAQLQIMYGIRGERRLGEWTVDWLDGYANSKPVRVGNAAAQQLQLDVYGEVIGTLYNARVGGLARNDASWALECALIEHVSKIWREPDEGLWEVRGPRRHFTFSKAMCWLAFDRAVKSVEKFDLPGDVERWRTIRDEIHQDVCDKAYDAARGHFTQSYGDGLLDGSLLLLPQIGFLPIDDPRIATTIAAIERHLMVEGYVLRYRTDQTQDGLPPGEGAFLACSFWLADAMTMQGRLDEATALFERLLGLANDVGLLAEEYDPRAKRHLGNFPQAFSHVALVNTAYNLLRGGRPLHQQAAGTSAK